MPGEAATADVACARGLLGFARPSSSAVVSIGIGSVLGLFGFRHFGGFDHHRLMLVFGLGRFRRGDGVRRLRSLERLTGEHPQPAAPIALDANEPVPLARPQQVHQPVEPVSSLVESARPGGVPLGVRSRASVAAIRAQQLLHVANVHRPAGGRGALENLPRELDAVGISAHLRADRLFVPGRLMAAVDRGGGTADERP